MPKSPLFIEGYGFSISLSSEGRRGCNATDPVNQLLNYSYAILSSNVLKHVVALGIDPTREVYHHRQEATFPFLYDLMEPFRPLADHAVFTFVHRQKRSLHGKEAVLRPAILRRFRAHWTKVMQCPQPWSHSSQTLDQLIQRFIVNVKSRNLGLTKLLFFAVMTRISQICRRGESVPCSRVPDSRFQK